ncbi:hypothetical protein PG993_007347 [Apiospora rasikravindrae]|uniref:LYC1 C-terminal domain-containing protein n=1 Tax=Apiospora rasikravindrae TaxID=990691 RepID=A0ABR1SX89_9PEZI
MTTSQDHRITINTPDDGLIELVFGEASPEQRVECFKQAGRTFVRSVPEDQWVAAEKQLEQLPLLRGKGCRHWCLYKPDAPKEIVSSLRAIRREVLIRDERGVRQETGYDIAMVATDAKYRGHGLASFLTRKVGEWADGPGAAPVTTLYTAVGPFYVKLGWELLPAPQVSCELPPGVSLDALQRKRGGNQLLPTRLAGPDEMPDLCNRDIAQLRTRVEAYDLAPNTSLVTTLPIPEQLEWYQEMAKLQSLTWCNGREIKAVGAICEEADTWILWYQDLSHKELKIVRVKPGYGNPDLTKQALVQLLSRAMEEAVSWEGLLAKIMIWDPSSEVLGALEMLGKEMGFTPKSEMRDGVNQTSIRWAKADKRQTIFWPNEYYACN